MLQPLRLTRVVIALIAFSGARFITNGDYEGSDGLRVKDFPELKIRTDENGKQKEVAFEKIVEIMSREVPIPTSKRYNSKFGGNDLHCFLIHLAASNGYAESGMKGLVTKEEPIIPPEKIPLGSWIRDTEEKVPESIMVEKLKNALNSTVQQLSTNFRLFSAPIIGGADTHKIRRYDPNLDHGYLTRGKHEKGTSTFEKYMTLQSVEEGRRVAREGIHMTNRCKFCKGNGKFARVDMGTPNGAIGWRASCPDSNPQTVAKANMVEQHRKF